MSVGEMSTEVRPVLSLVLETNANEVSSKWPQNLLRDHMHLEGFEQMVSLCTSAMWSSNGLWVTGTSLCSHLHGLRLPPGLQPSVSGEALVRCFSNVGVPAQPPRMCGGVFNHTP